MLFPDLLASLPPDPRIVIAFSGGPDSVFLAEALYAVVPPANLTIAHFDHALREESSSDAAFSKAWAEKKQLPFFCERWQDPIPSEDKARNARQQFLFKIRDTVNADAVALGTHADDVAETIFFRFLRGSGMAGLAGIKRFDSETKLFRPLLSLKKADILKQLNKQKLPFVTDSTNAESSYSRNFLRNEVFPLINSRFPGFQERIVRQADIFRMASDYFRTEAETFLNQFPQDPKNGERRIERVKFRFLPEILQTEVIRRLLSPQTLDVEQTLALVEFVKNAASGKKMLLGKQSFIIYADTLFVRDL